MTIHKREKRKEALGRFWADGYANHVSGVHKLREKKRMIEYWNNLFNETVNPSPPDKVTSPS